MQRWTISNKEETLAVHAGGYTLVRVPKGCIRVTILSAGYYKRDSICELEEVVNLGEETSITLPRIMCGNSLVWSSLPDWCVKVVSKLWAELSAGTNIDMKIFSGFSYSYTDENGDLVSLCMHTDAAKFIG